MYCNYVSSLNLGAKIHNRCITPAEKRFLKRLKTKIFFAHPYSSWEKGCIEYHNKLIRQYIPKGTDFEDVSDGILKDIITKINKRPREKLGFSSPVAEFFKFIA